MGTSNARSFDWRCFGGTWGVSLESWVLQRILIFRYMSRSTGRVVLALSFLVGCQGMLGWFMVKSGLSVNIIEEKKPARVSHLFLSAHLASAFLIYAGLITESLKILTGNQAMKPIRQLRGLGIYTAGLVALIYVTVISGAWVAGLDAGLIYNEFPYMGINLVPSDMWSLSTSPNTMTWYENLIHNPASVQFIHRSLAITTFTLVAIGWVSTRIFVKHRVHRGAFNLLFAVVGCQATLGIATLLMYVPVNLAATHQAGSLTLFTVALWILHRIRTTR